MVPDGAGAGGSPDGAAKTSEGNGFIERLTLHLRSRMVWPAAVVHMMADMS